VSCLFAKLLRIVLDCGRVVATVLEKGETLGGTTLHVRPLSSTGSNRSEEEGEWNVLQDPSKH